MNSGLKLISCNFRCYKTCCNKLNCDIKSIIYIIDLIEATENMTLKIPKQKIYVKIKTFSSLITGHIHVITGGRIIDYLSSQNNKFIPVTDAQVYPLKSEIEPDLNISGKNEVVFLNVEDIEMITECEEKETKD